MFLARLLLLAVQDRAICTPPSEEAPGTCSLVSPHTLFANTNLSHFIAPLYYLQHHALLQIELAHLAPAWAAVSLEPYVHVLILRLTIPLEPCASLLRPDLWLYKPSLPLLSPSRRIEPSRTDIFCHIDKRARRSTLTATIALRHRHSCIPRPGPACPIRFRHGGPLRSLEWEEVANLCLRPHLLACRAYHVLQR